jgi:hypothetical protein
MSLCFNQQTGLPKTEGRHVHVKVLISTGAGFIGFVPYANTTVRTNSFIERLPSWQMSRFKKENLL